MYLDSNIDIYITLILRLFHIFTKIPRKQDVE